MTPVRTVARVGVGIALLSAVTACSLGAEGTPPTDIAPTLVKRTASTSSIDPFSGPAPMSVVTWWKERPAAAPANMSNRKLLLNARGTGPSRFVGPDMRGYNEVLMAITCTSKVAFAVRLEVVDGLSIASTSGDSCGGPEVSVFISPPLSSFDPATQVEVQVPAGTQYYVTLYGTPAQ